MATQNVLTARTEFASALNQICSERGIEPAIVIATIESAILAAYRKDYGLDEAYVYKAQIDPDNGEAKIFRYPKLETEEETVEEPEEGAPEVEAAYDETKQEEVTPPGFGRIASQTAKQVILQKIREAEKDAILKEYQDRIGTLVSGMVLRHDGQFVIVDIGRGQAQMPPQEQIPGEHYTLNKRMTFYIQDIRETMKGRQIIVSRAASELVAKLFEREVPEVASGAVEIRTIAREAGGRTKLAVFSAQSGVDPVGSCVGQKGVRVQTVIDELNREKIDIIQYSDDPIRFLTAALAPAENLQIELNEKDKSAVVTVPEDQLSLAIGRDGQNVRLAAKLTGYKIDIKGPGGTLTESEKKKMAEAKKAEEAKEKESSDDEQEKTTKKTKKEAKTEAKATKAKEDKKEDKTESEA
ncbi:transcription termination/antitermination protein NusA [Candidatus Beckwithbacteria bacterium]|nr:transcription termination/antitermination protein NusA [Candidatus Beckwithbacteria bacterium]